MEYYEVEEIVRAIAEVEKLYTTGSLSQEKNAQEKSAEQIELAHLKRQITQILNLQVRNFMQDTPYFASAGNQQILIDGDEFWEDELYCLHQIMASYLRCYKLLKKEQEIFREV